MLSARMWVVFGMSLWGLFACKNDEPIKASSTCPGEQTECGNLCVSLERDAEHCGACGRVCDAGETCTDGACVVRCPRSLSACGDTCADLDVDPSHCGACGSACEEGKVCVNGGCNQACPAGQEACDSRCVSTDNDAQHCGGCGNACAPGDACVKGACAECVAGTMAGEFPQVVAGELATSRHTVSCGFEKVGLHADVSYAFTAPAAGIYEVDSEGSEVDVVTALLDGTCGGRTLGCADTSEAGPERTLRIALAKGETVVVVAESKVKKLGRVQLRMNMVEGETPPTESCMPIALGGEVPRTLVGDTSKATQTITASCGAPATPDLLYQFTAPESGRYDFDTFGSNFDTVLSVLKGGCDGQELACDDDSGSGEASMVSIKLVQGETVLIAVDGFEQTGKFTLHVSASSFGDLDPCCFGSNLGGCGNDPIEQCVCAADEYCCTKEWDELCAQYAQQECELSCELPRGECELTDLGSTVPQTTNGTTLGGVNVLTPSCSEDGSPERAYSFTAPETGAYAFDTAGSVHDTVVYVLNGGCKGEELACNDDFGKDNRQSRAIVSLTAGQTVTVVVDGYGGAAEDFVLAIERADETPAGNCCVPHEGSGCSVAAIQACVCAEDDACCDPDMSWDDICVSGVVAFECASCE